MCVLHHPLHQSTMHHLPLCAGEPRDANKISSFVHSFWQPSYFLFISLCFFLSFIFCCVLFCLVVCYFFSLAVHCSYIVWINFTDLFFCLSISSALMWKLYACMHASVCVRMRKKKIKVLITYSRVYSFNWNCGFTFSLFWVSCFFDIPHLECLNV